MIIPNKKIEDAINIAKEVINGIVVGDPQKPETTLGLVVNKIQYEKN